MNSFLKGLINILDFLYLCRDKYVPMTDEKAIEHDYKAIQSDWDTIGRDMRTILISHEKDKI